MPYAYVARQTNWRTSCTIWPICYEYQTRAVSELCVLENIIDVTEDSICSPRGSKQVSNSGSPIKVTAFRQNIGGQNKLQISFDIEHVGNGKIYEISDPVTCPKESLDIRTREDTIKVKLNTGIQGGELRCAGLDDSTSTEGVSEGIVRLFDNGRTITCTQELPGDSNYIKPVTITIHFIYFDKGDKEVLVRRASGTME